MQETEKPEKPEKQEQEKQEQEQEQEQETTGMIEMTEGNQVQGYLVCQELAMMTLQVMSLTENRNRFAGGKKRVCLVRSCCCINNHDTLF